MKIKFKWDNKITNIDYNYEENWVLQVVTDWWDIHMVIVDYATKDIISSKNHLEFDWYIEDLISSDNFWDTHTFSKKVLEYLEYLDDDYIKKLFKGLTENNQIHWWAFHHSVEELFTKLYENKKHLFNKNEKIKIEKIME